MFHEYSQSAVFEQRASFVHYVCFCPRAQFRTLKLSSFKYCMIFNVICSCSNMLPKISKTADWFPICGGNRSRGSHAWKEPNRNKKTSELCLFFSPLCLKEFRKCEWKEIMMTKSCRNALKFEMVVVNVETLWNRGSNQGRHALKE